MRNMSYPVLDDVGYPPVDSPVVEDNPPDGLSQDELKRAVEKFTAANAERERSRRAQEQEQGKMAFQEGFGKLDRKVEQADRFTCFGHDEHVETQLHTAARSGSVEVVKVILDEFPEAVRIVTQAGENCLHTAVSYGRVKAVQFLVDWLAGNPRFAMEVLNGKDYGGHTPLHLAISRKQIQTLKVLLSGNPSISRLVDVNAKNSGGFTALDILDVQPYSGNIRIEIDELLHLAGALRARDLSLRDTWKWFTTPISNNFLPSLERRKLFLLLISALTAALTYLEAVTVARGTLNGILQTMKNDPLINSHFIIFNSRVFIGSLAVFVFLLHDFPLKPWPQISALMLFGSYMCCIISIAPEKARSVFLQATPLLLLAAAAKRFALGQIKGF